MAIECVEVQEWIEEEVTRPVEEWVEKTEEKCKEYPWYDPRGWVCWIVTTFVKVVTWVVEKVGKWVVRTVCKLVTTLIDMIGGILAGLWDIVAGIFTLDWRRIVDGLIGIGSAIVDGVTKIIRILVGLDTLAYIIEEIQRGRLRDYVRGLIDASGFSDDTKQRMKDAIRVDHGAFGLRLNGRSVRTFIDSERRTREQPDIPNLVLLHEAGAINLRELCGFEFPQFWNRKRYKTIKKGVVVGGGGGGEFDNPISAEELETYLSSRGADGPKFIVRAMRDSVLETKLDAARLKGRELGLILSFDKEEVEVIKPNHIVHPGFDTTSFGTSMQEFLQDVCGRIDKNDSPAGAISDLCRPLIAGVFKYTDGLRGLAACLAGSRCGQVPHDASGTTYIDNQPDIIWKYVPIHELGHYFGLCHTDGIDRIMYSARQKSWFSPGLFGMVFLWGEPGFTLDEGKEAWDYIMANFSEGCLTHG